MPRTTIFALACFAAFPAMASPTVPEPRPALAAEKPLVDPVTLAVNEAAVKKEQAAAEARSKAWDAKLRKAMSGVCNGC